MPLFLNSLFNLMSALGVISLLIFLGLGTSLYFFIFICLIPPLLLSISYFKRVHKEQRSYAMYAAFSFPYTVSILHSLWFVAELNWLTSGAAPFQLHSWVYFVDAVVLITLAINAISSISHLCSAQPINSIVNASSTLKKTQLVTGALVFIYLGCSYISHELTPSKAVDYSTMTVPHFLASINTDQDLTAALKADIVGELSIKKSLALVPKYKDFLNRINDSDLEYMFSMHSNSVDYSVDLKLIKIAMQLKSGEITPFEAQTLLND